MTDAYRETLRWLYGLAPRGIRLDLERLREACRRRGDPTERLRVVHVAGTNGKGSTSATIERIAREAGLTTGLYTSPHLHSFTERVRVNGQPIGRDEVVERATSLRAMLSEPGAPELTFFEVTTLLAFEAFAARSLDLVVLEVGLGGRLDATNVIERPIASVITHVDLDHQAYLGGTLGEIAREKAGIIRARVPVVHAGDTDAEVRDGREGVRVRDVVDARAAELEAPSMALGREVRWGADGGGLFVEVPGRRVEGLHPRLEGDHQKANAALAVAAVLCFAERSGLTVDDDAFRRGVANVEWAGRLERVAREGQEFVFDAAHNPDGVRALVAWLRARPRERRVLVFGAMADKDWRGMAGALRDEVDEVVCVAPPLSRAERPEVLASALGGVAATSVAEGVELARGRAGAGGLVLVCGSIFVLAEGRAHVLGVPHEPLIAM